MHQGHYHHYPFRYSKIIFYRHFPSNLSRRIYIANDVHSWSNNDAVLLTVFFDATTGWRHYNNRFVRRITTTQHALLRFQLDAFRTVRPRPWSDKLYKDLPQSEDYSIRQFHHLDRVGNIIVFQFYRCIPEESIEANQRFFLDVHDGDFHHMKEEWREPTNWWWMCLLDVSVGSCSRRRNRYSWQRTFTANGWEKAHMLAWVTQALVM